jgi:hypothetical protein
VSDATADWYRRFAELEAHGQSVIYEEWARGVASDDAVLDLIRTLPAPRQQPNLVFACSRLLGAPESGYGQWREWLLRHADAVVAEARKRTTQTNEPRRCAALLPVLAQIPGPIALLEVGTSAGLCLFPDRYSYSYDGGPPLNPVDGPSSVLLECATTGPLPLPDRLPNVVWRAGLDLHPLRTDDEDAVTWLETLVWPEQHERRARIRAALDIVRADPPLLVEGDLAVDLASLAALAPSDATLVVFHTAVLPYVVRADRERFFDTVRSLDCVWISNEPHAATPWMFPDGPRPATTFALGRDGELLALTGAHGQSIDWLAPRLGGAAGCSP